MTTDPADEVARVREVYARRRPAMSSKWHPLRPDQVMIDASRRRVWGALLLGLDRELGDVVEVGCGSGAVARWAGSAGARRVVGLDMLVDELGTAAESSGRPLAYTAADGRRLPLRAASFDTAICSTLFSSVLDDDVAAAIAAEIRRVLRPTGTVLWFDFVRGNPSNRDVRGVPVRAVEGLFPGFRLAGERVVLAPPIGRRLERHSRVALALEQVRPLRTHLAAVLVPEGAPRVRSGRPPGRPSRRVSRAESLVGHPPESRRPGSDQCH